MRMHRLRNRILQQLYRPSPIKLFSAQTLASLDALDKAIEEKITPLLAELLRL